MVMIYISLQCIGCVKEETFSLTFRGIVFRSNNQINLLAKAELCSAFFSPQLGLGVARGLHFR